MDIISLINAISTNWKAVLLAYPNWENVKVFLSNEKSIYGEDVPTFPSPENIFRCFNYFNIEDTNVVILGQDPYHGDNQAMGLCFGIPDGVKTPPSLKNIEKELARDVGATLKSKTLEGWASQGMLLLNSALTVRKKNPSSHLAVWLPFTKYIINYLNKTQTGIIFVAWGVFAYNKLKDIDTKKHGLIVSSHPSPFSVYRSLERHPPFHDSHPFTQINEYCALKGKGVCMDFNTSHIIYIFYVPHVYFHKI